MRRFDFLRDPMTAWVEYLRAIEIPRRSIAPAACGGAILAGVAAWTAFDTAAVHSARTAQTAARARVERAERELERTRVARERLEASARRLRRLQAIRRSGLRTAGAVARLGNAAGEGTSLESIAYGRQTTIKGRASSVAQLAALLAGIARAPRNGRIAAVRFSSDVRVSGGLTFEVQVEGSAR